MRVFFNSFICSQRIYYPQLLDQTTLNIPQLTLYAFFIFRFSKNIYRRINHLIVGFITFNKLNLLFHELFY